jgi:hypothetical protein
MTPAALFARFRRWLYLLGIGMWRGEQALTLWERGRLTYLGAGVMRGPRGQRSIFFTRDFYGERPTQIFEEALND